jgi:nucleoside-diphosphate-sugar epimerase
VSRVLVTGASGLIGREAVPLLVERGHEVHVISRRDQPDPRDGTVWHSADLLDGDAGAEVVRSVRPELLLHLAWEGGRAAGRRSPVNLDWTAASARLWSAFAEKGGSRSLVAGTCAEYEWVEPVLSEDARLRPGSLHGTCKDALRRMIEAAAGPLGVSAAWARLFFVYGAEESSERLVSAITRSLLNGEPALASSGEQLRDLVYAPDAAAAMVGLLEGHFEGAVNVGTGVGTRVKDVVTELGRLAGRPDLVRLGAIPSTDGDPPSIVADVSLLREQIDWEPVLPLDGGLSETFERLKAASG